MRSGLLSEMELVGGETLRNNWWLRLFCSVRSDGRTSPVAFDDFIRHGWPYVVRTILHRWHVSFCHDLSLIRQYIYIAIPPAGLSAANTRDTCAQTPNELSPRIVNCRANLPKPIVTRAFELLGNYFP